MWVESTLLFLCSSPLLCSLMVAALMGVEKVRVTRLELDDLRLNEAMEQIDEARISLTVTIDRSLSFATFTPQLLHLTLQ
jgi:hypothetical protein